MVRWPLLTLVLILFQLVLSWRCSIGLTRWSSRPMVIWAILTSPWSITWWGWWTPSITLPTPQLSAQVIYLQLQLSCLLVVWDMTPCPWVTPFCMLCMVRLYQNTWCTLPISPSLQVDELVFPLWAYEFLPIWPHVNHDYSGHTYSSLMFPQTAPIVRTQKSNNTSPLRIVSFVQFN